MKQPYRIILSLLTVLLLLNSCNYSEKKEADNAIRSITKIIDLMNEIVEADVEDTNPDEIKVNDRIKGKIVKVYDGDTYDLQIDKNRTINIRMHGIDAPERDMPFYKVSKNYLAEMVENKNVEALIADIDQYGRYVAYTFLDDGSDLNKEMIRAGMAWHYIQFNKEKELTQLEKMARENKLGLWHEYPYVIEPWKVRKLRKKGYKTDMIYKAQREHITNKHATRCPDKHLCNIIFE